MPIESLLAFVLASALLSVAPGPDNIFVLTQSALYGKKIGVLVTLGLCTGLIVHTLAVALGVAVVFQTPVIAFTVLKIAGAAYLLYLAFLLQFASPEYGALAPQIFLLGAVFISVASVIFCAIAVRAATLGRWLNRSPRSQVYLNRIAGTIFVGLAFKLATATAHAK